ncbi:MAG: hypothetical protein ACI4VQ_01735 [Clostridia bacterium]
MKIIKTSKYKSNLQKKIIKKHLRREEHTIEAIEELIMQSRTMQELMLNPLSRVYNINKKNGVLKEIYTANVNNKIRMYIKPIGIYPYNLNEIIEVELEEIDDHHYGEG